MSGKSRSSDARRRINSSIVYISPSSAGTSVLVGVFSVAVIVDSVAVIVDSVAVIVDDIGSLRPAKDCSLISEDAGLGIVQSGLLYAG
jgi:hypothetical protein